MRTLTAQEARASACCGTCDKFGDDFCRHLRVKRNRLTFFGQAWRADCYVETRPVGREIPAQQTLMGGGDVMGDNGKCAPKECGATPCDPEDKSVAETPADPPAEGCDKVCPPAERAAEPVGAEA